MSFESLKNSAVYSTFIEMLLSLIFPNRVTITFARKGYHIQIFEIEWQKLSSAEVVAQK